MPLVHSSTEIAVLCEDCGDYKKPSCVLDEGTSLVPGGAKVELCYGCARSRLEKKATWVASGKDLKDFVPDPIGYLKPVGWSPPGEELEEGVFTSRKKK
jgi:hypothetical protein